LHTLLKDIEEEEKMSQHWTGKWKSPACGALLAIAILFRSLSVYPNAAPIEVIMTPLSMAAFIRSILICQQELF